VKTMQQFEDIRRRDARINALARECELWQRAEAAVFAVLGEPWRGRVRVLFCRPPEWVLGVTSSAWILPLRAQSERLRAALSGALEQTLQPPRFRVVAPEPIRRVRTAQLPPPSARQALQQLADALEQQGPPDGRSQPAELALARALRRLAEPRRDT